MPIVVCSAFDSRRPVEAECVLKSPYKLHAFMDWHHRNRLISLLSLPGANLTKDKGIDYEQENPREHGGPDTNKGDAYRKQKN